MSDRARHQGIAASEGVRQAFRTITGHRMRSLLLILGVAIGVTTLVAIVSIVTGLSGRIRQDIVSGNRPYVYVSRYSGLGGEDPDEMLRRPHLLPEVAEALAATPGVGVVDYQLSNNSGTVLKHGDERTNFVQVFGSSEHFPWIFSIGVAEGRFFTAGEVASSERVVVLGHGPRQDLFPRLDPVGKSLRIYGRPYRIVGVMAERRHIVGALGDNFAVVPWTAFEKDGLREGFEDRNIAVTVADGWQTDEAVSAITGAVRQARRLRPGQANDFDVVASETYGEIVDKVTGGIASGPVLSRPRCAAADRSVDGRRHEPMHHDNPARPRAGLPGTDAPASSDTDYREAPRKAKIKKAMTYPTGVVIVAIVVTAILLIKVVPQF
ncbi:MAG: ABC transporter permease, partial [Candidatus Krumholzibacteriia bacterium]